MGWIAWMAAGVLCLLLFWALAIRPCRRREEEMQRFAAQYYAHRGLHNEAEGIPENSMGAFARAVAEGYGIELDVHLSRDGEAVVFHDDNLRRMCGVDACVTDLSWAELSKLHLRGTEYTIPRFSDVLALVGGTVPLIIELKFERHAKKLCETVNGLLAAYPGAYCIESFDPRCVWWFRRHQCAILRGQLAESFRVHGMKLNRALDFLLKNLLLNFWALPDFVAYNMEDIHRARSFRLCCWLYHVQKVFWVVRSPEQCMVAKGEQAIMIFEHFDPRAAEAAWEKAQQAAK